MKTKYMLAILISVVLSISAHAEESTAYTKEYYENQIRIKDGLEFQDRLTRTMNRANTIVIAKYTGHERIAQLSTNNATSLTYFFKPLSFIKGQKADVINLLANEIGDSPFIEGHAYLMLIDRTGSDKINPVDTSYQYTPNWWYNLISLSLIIPVEWSKQ